MYLKFQSHELMNPIKTEEENKEDELMNPVKTKEEAKKRSKQLILVNAVKLKRIIFLKTFLDTNTNNEELMSYCDNSGLSVLIDSCVIYNRLNWSSFSVGRRTDLRVILINRTRRSVLRPTEKELQFSQILNYARGLMHAVQTNSMEIVNMCLENEAKKSINLVDDNGWTAVAISQDKSDKAITSLLLENGASFNV